MKYALFALSLLLAGCALIPVNSTITITPNTNVNPNTEILTRK